MMRTVRRREHEQQEENVCEKEIKRQGLVKRNSSECIQFICLFISSSDFVLSLSDSLSVLFRTECGFIRDNEENDSQVLKKK